MNAGYRTAPQGSKLPPRRKTLTLLIANLLAGPGMNGLLGCDHTHRPREDRPDGSGNVPIPGTALPVPAYTPRRHRRYLSPQGSDSNSGLTPATAWRRLQENVARIPANTEVIFGDGDYRFEGSVYASTAGTAPLAPNVTLRAANYRRTRLRGPPTASTTAGSAGIAFLFLGRDIGPELWGFVVEGWAGGGAGTILVEDDVSKLRIAGNLFRRNGSTRFHHTIYLSGGQTLESTQRDWVIEGNHVELAPGSGAFLNIRGGPFGAHRGVIRHNEVIGFGRWAIVQNDVRQPGTLSAIRVQENRFRAHFDQAVIQFADYNTPEHLHGVDESYEVEANWLENLNPEAQVIWIYPPITAPNQPHQPTLRGNAYKATSGKPDDPLPPNYESKSKPP